MAKPKNLVPLNWDDVRFFLAIHRGGSLSAAAGLLEVTQPTAGRRLDALEATLGLTLFDRTPAGLQLTTEGSTLLDAAVAMEEQAREISLRAATKERELEGLVRIASTEAFATIFLAPATQKVHERYPGIRIELVLSNTEADLLKGESDIALRFRPEGLRPAPEALFAQKLGDEPFLLYGADSYLRKRGTPSDPTKLAGHDIVEFVGRHPAMDWCARAYRGATVVLSAPSMLVVAGAIAAGMGIGVIPKRGARSSPALLPISPVVARGTGWLIVHPRLRRVPRVRAVVDMLAAVYRAETV